MSICRKPYPSNVSDEKWSLVVPYLLLQREDGRPEIDNIAERALRGIAVGAATGCSPAHVSVASGPPPSTPSSPLGRTHAVELDSRTCQTGGMSAETIARLHIVLDDVEPSMTA